MNFKPCQRFCWVCNGKRDVVFRFELDWEEHEVAYRTCAGCGANFGQGCVLHFAVREDMTACLLPRHDHGPRVTTPNVEEIECLDCLEMLVSTFAEAPVVDWRPDQALAEDLYAA